MIKIALLAAAFTLESCGNTDEDPRHFMWIDLANASDQTLVVAVDGSTYQVPERDAKILHGWQCSTGQCGRVSGRRMVVTVRNLAGICLGGFAMGSARCEDSEYALKCLDGQCNIQGRDTDQQFDAVGCDGLSATGPSSALIAKKDPLNGPFCGLRQRVERL